MNLQKIEAPPQVPVLTRQFRSDPDPRAPEEIQTLSAANTGVCGSGLAQFAESIYR